MFPVYHCILILWIHVSAQFQSANRNNRGFGNRNTRDRKRSLDSPRDRKSRFSRSSPKRNEGSTKKADSARKDKDRRRSGIFAQYDSYFYSPFHSLHSRPSVCCCSYKADRSNPHSVTLTTYKMVLFKNPSIEMLFTGVEAPCPVHMAASCVKPVLGVLVECLQLEQMDMKMYLHVGKYFKQTIQFPYKIIHMLHLPPPTYSTSSYL